MRKLVLPGVLLLVNISINALPFTKEQIQYYEDQAIFQTKLNIAEVILQEGEISLLEYPIYEYQIYSIGSTKLRLLRNAIFAKHGYIFKDQELKKYFEGKDWYKPRFEEIPKDLNQNETDNVELLFETQKIWDAHEALRINDEDLIGMWHQMPVVPAGFANRYFFYSDHGFKFASNEMDGGCRIKRLYGKWKLVDNFVEVQIDAEDILNGGEIVGPWGSYGSKFVIDNGTIKEQALDPPLLFRIPIYLYIKNDDLDGKLRYTLPSLNFGAIRYWRMYNKPDEGDD